ncbi:hypothetical protein [Candidatus Thiothrix anitrata]|jgi:hypothetical protein|uniref:Translation initiation factor 2 n=1 Tax=Candidatus Thiothrix anitrata TaxID=2823902 RepID=A0ABX7X5L8_9GAMM|nr:hypothetical protein [Candidatus Thiothrix anitrata]QTR50552.1 hypothetical protein J8380_02995 [Candidatus Thiothrix anitrata]
MEKAQNPSNITEVVDELHDVEDELQHFEEKQVNVTRTLQMIVYPAMVAFIILSAYGFFLVQSLTTDVHRLTETITSMNESVQTNMQSIAGTMGTMSNQMGALVESTGNMSNNIVGMNSSTQDMAGNIQQMNASTQNMAVSTYNMQRDMWSMNKNISGPMKMFNKFSPFGSDKTSPYVVPPPATTAVTPNPYYNYYGAQQSAQPATTQAPASAPVATQQPTTPGVVAPTVAPAAPADGAATAKDGHSAVELPNEQLLASATRG